MPGEPLGEPPVTDTQQHQATATAYGQAMTAGDIYTVAGNGTFGFSGDSGSATAAELGSPGQTALDDAGNLVIADIGNNRVRVVAASGGTFYGQAMTAGDIYTVAGNGGSGIGRDGGPATGTSVPNPAAVAADDAGNLLVTDEFHRVRLVAASTGSFYGKAATAGDIYTMAGNATSGFSGDNGPAIRAEFNFPAGVAVDGAGNLAIADQFNNRVRLVAATSGTFYGKAMTAGDAYTVAGTGKIGHGGDGGPATSAGLYFLAGMAVDGAGNLVIADTNNERIRVVAGSTGTFFSKAMTAAGEKASAATPYTVSVGSTASSPLRSTDVASLIPAARCAASVQSYRALMSQSFHPPARAGAHKPRPPPRRARTASSELPRNRNIRDRRTVPAPGAHDHGRSPRENREGIVRDHEAALLPGRDGTAGPAGRT